MPLLSTLRVVITGDNSDAERAIKETRRDIRSFSNDATSVSADMSKALNFAKLAASTTLMSGALAGLGGAAIGALEATSGALLGIASAGGIAATGLGIWGLFAAGALDGVGDAYGKYQDAVDAAREALAKGDGKAYNAALDAQKQALANLTPDQKEFVLSLVDLRNEWTSLSQAMAPDLFEALGKAMDTFQGLLPKLLPVAESVGDAVYGLMDKFENWLKGDQFAGWLKTVQDEAPGFITSFGNIGGNLGSALIDGLTKSVPLGKQVMADLEELTAGIAKGVNSKGFEDFLGFASDMLPLVEGLLKTTGGALLELAKALQPLAAPAIAVIDGIVGALGKVFGSDAFAGFVDEIAKGLPILAPIVFQLLTAVEPLLPLVGALADLLVQGLGAGAKVLVPLLYGISGALGALSPLVDAGAQVFAMLGDALEPVAGTLMQALFDAFVKLQPAIQAAADAFTDEFAAQLPTLVAALSELTPKLVSLIQIIAEDAVGAFEQLAPHLPELADALVKAMVAGVDLVIAITPLLPFLVDAAANMQTWLPLVVMLTSQLETLTAVLGFFTPILGFAVDCLVLMKEGADSVFEAVKPFIPVVANVALELAKWSPVVRTITTAFSFFAAIINDVVKPAVEWFVNHAGAVTGLLGGGLLKGGGSKWYSALPFFDDGGTMPGPRGVHSLAWVAGGETILPTHKSGVSLAQGPSVGAGSSLTIEGGVHITVGSGDPEALKAAAVEALREAASGARVGIRQTRRS